MRLWTPAYLALALGLSACAADGLDDADPPSELGPGADGGCTECDDSGPGKTDEADSEKVQVDIVCFPGDGAELCLPVYELDPLPAELVYGEGPPANYFSSNPQVAVENYRAPRAFIDLEEAFAEHGDDVKILPNFGLAEIGQRRVGKWAVLQPHAFAHLQELRDLNGPTSVVSGYRSPGYNDTGGGSGRASSSRHMWGDAFDFDPPVDLLVAKAQCEELGAYFINLYTTHIHCDWRHQPVDERFFGPAMDQTARAARRDRDALASGYDARIDVTAGDALEVSYQGFDEGEPIIEWHALDASGKSIATGSGARFAAPAGAVRAHVNVAGWLTRSVEL